MSIVNGPLDKIICDRCHCILGSMRSFNRHRQHSCKKNPDRVPRKDILSRTQHRRMMKAIDNTNECLIPNEPEGCEMVDKPSKEIPNEMYEMLNGIQDHLNKITQIEWNVKSIGDKLDKMHTKATNVFNIDKIQIYMTDSIDFVDVLTKRMGSRKQAVDYIRSKIHKKAEGDIDVFCEIYLSGRPDTWPISCPDKKHHVYRIAQPNAEVINDPGGIQIYKMFKNVYSNTLLRLNNSMIFDTLNKIPGTVEYEESRDELLDSFEMGLIQDKAHDLCKAPCDPFIKRLSIKFKSLEKSYELDAY